MADINRATAPITNRNIIQPTKENRTSEQVPFDFKDTSKVKQALAETNLSGQNNVLREDGSTSGFYEILHNPDISSAFLKNIFLLREIVGILPLNNSVQTEEMNDLINRLVLKPDEIAGEMMRQEDISTLFKGGLFDMLRQLSEENPTPEFSSSISNLLKTINNESSKDGILDSVENSLNNLKQEFSASKSISSEISKLSEKLISFRNIADTEKASAEFPKLKSEILSFFRSTEKSILYNNNILKSISMATYNLSRINTSTNAVSDAFSNLLKLMKDDSQKENLTNALLKFFDDNSHVSSSKTMNALTEILKKQSENPDLKLLNSDSMDKIIHSLLSSPCNFTPLLHFVIPVEYENTQASAEIWINPDGEDDMQNSDGKKYTHILSVFEIQDIGKFEAELFVEKKNIQLSIFCPEQHIDYFKNSLSDIKKSIDNSEYKIKSVTIDKLIETRSLIQVFKSLPERRQGVNVTI